jgi:uncharacterized integral membrane protein (TIGR00698 family)
MDFLKSKGKGILLCLVIALFAWVLVNSITWMEVIGAPVIAILVGMLLTLIIKDKSSVSEGIGFTSKKILQYAVILLGFGLNLATIAKVGLASLPIILSTISTSLLVAYAMHRLLKLPAKTSTLIGVGSSICGGSAIAATAPVIDADDEEIAQAISVIFFFNVIAAIIFPTLGTVLGLSNSGFGLFAGTAINDTSSVTAAASTWDTLHGTNGTVLAYATIVKLTRTLAIIPITLVLSFLRIRNEKKKNVIGQTKVSIRKIFPMFILYFIIASIITTIITSFCSGTSLAVAKSSFIFLKQLSKFFIVMAMSAIGLNTNIIKLIMKGGKPILMGFCCWIAIATVSLLLQNLLQLL